jgi:hypothetical protein
MKEDRSIGTGSSKKIDIDLSKLWEIGFKDFNLDLIVDVTDDTSQKKNKISFPKNKKSEINSIEIESDILEDSIIDISSSSENKVNQRRQEILEKKFTNNLINCFIEEDFEFGFISRSELIIRKQFSINALATRNWLNELFIKNFKTEKILLGLLRILGRFEEEIIFPQGQTMALAALVHENNEIKELGIRAFENWNSINSLEVLKKVNIESKWLKDYLIQVIDDLTKELCLS